MKKINKVDLYNNLVYVFSIMVLLISYLIFPLYYFACKENSKRIAIQRAEYTAVQMAGIREQQALDISNRVVNREAAEKFAAAHTLLQEHHESVCSTILPVKNIAQKPQLPNGCEITSATIVLNYLGYKIDKVTMADVYLPRQYPYYSVNPNIAYMGNPHGLGWYCYAGPIVQAVNDYFSSIGVTEHQAKDITGADIEDLKTYIRNGHPIVFWGTIGFTSPRRTRSFMTPNGEYAYTNLHCLVVSGYDEEYMYITDPLYITSKVSIEWFEQIYNSMGKRAVLIA